MKRTIMSALAAIAVASATTAVAYAQAKPMPTHYLPAVKIVQCFVTPPKALSKKASGTQIVYVNAGKVSLSSITFAVGYRNSDSSYLRRVTDVGAFAPGAKIDHHFSLYNDVTYGGKATSSCGALSAKH